jgi:hypothetical protein
MIYFLGSALIAIVVVIGLVAVFVKKRRERHY